MHLCVANQCNGGGGDQLNAGLSPCATPCPLSPLATRCVAGYEVVCQAAGVRRADGCEAERGGYLWLAGVSRRDSWQSPAPQHPNHDPTPIPSPTSHHVVVLFVMQIQVLCTPWCPRVATCGLRREQDWMVLPQLRGLRPGLKLPPGPHASESARGRLG